MRRTTSTLRTSGPPSTGSGRPSDGRLRPRALAAEPDERLVELARAGDEAAFGAIVVRYRAPLLRYCLGFLPPEAAEDALQQTFVNAYAALARDDGRAPLTLRPWLYRVAHNAALNVARDPQAGLAPLPDDLDGVEPPDEAAMRRERFSRVVAAVRGLPPKQRQAIVRHAIEGESHHRIAADLGTSSGAIRQLVHRARRTVREAAAGLLPVPALRWLPLGSSLAETAAAVGGGAAAVKVVATIAVVAASGGAVVAASGGAVEATHHAHHATRTATVSVADTVATPAHPPTAASPNPVRRVPTASAPARRVPAATAPVRRAPARDDASGPGSADDRDSSGPGPGVALTDDSSHEGSVSSGSSGSGSPGPDSSGSDSSGSGSSGSGSSHDAMVTPTPTPTPTAESVTSSSGPGSSSSGGSDDPVTDDHSGRH